jgi:hypothetical protein
MRQLGPIPGTGCTELPDPMGGHGADMPAGKPPRLGPSGRPRAGAIPVQSGPEGTRLGARLPPIPTGMRVAHSATRAYRTRARINSSRHVLQEPGAAHRAALPHTLQSWALWTDRSPRGVQGGTTARLGGGPGPRPVVGDARGARRRAGAGSGLVVSTGRRCPQRGGASPELRPFVEAARHHHAGRERSLPGRHAGALRRPVPPRRAPHQLWLCSLVLHPFRTPNFARTPLAPQLQARFRSLAVSSGRRR